MNLLNYWKFFSANKFPRGSKLTFFADGSFAILYKQCVEFYTKEAELVFSLEGQSVYALTNGVIVIFQKNDFSCYCNGIRTTTYHIEDRGFVAVAGNTIQIKHIHDAADNFLTISKYGCIQSDRKVLAADYLMKDISADGRTIILYNLMQKYIVLRDLEIDPMDDCFRIEFLEDKKHYICNLNDPKADNRCVLYNSETDEEVYANNTPFVITPLGDCICLEGKIVATPAMDIIGDAQDLQAVYGNDRDFYCISPHKIRLKDQYGYWLSSQGMQLLLNTKECKLIGYFNDGRFYVMDLLDSSIHAQAVLFSEKDTSTAWTSYRNIVNSMIPKPRTL
jgi:hypothetical protein